MSDRNVVDAKDAAAYILSKFDRPLSTMKLQKLLFFSQGWALALLNRRLTDTTFQAWKWGPVSYDLYDLHRRKNEVTSIQGGDPSAVSGNNKVIIDAVINNYGGLSGMQLGDLTHLPGTPWTVVREDAGVRDKTAPSRIEIPDSLIKQHFKNVLPKPAKHRKPMGA